MRKLGIGRTTLGVAALLLCTSLAAAQDRPRIVAVSYALQALAERLVAAQADVVFPVPPGTDPSFWRPAISDISAIQSADLILLNGAGFATWVDRVSLPRSKLVNTSSAFSDRYITTESITHAHGDGGEHSHEGVAAYTWLDPRLAIAQAEAVAAAITRRGLAPKDAVAERLEALRADLEATAEQAAAALAAAAGGPIIATHPRYQYLARAFGLQIASLEWEAGAMPSAEDLADLGALAQSSGARVLIWEAEPPQGAAEAVAKLGLSSVTFPPLAQSPQGQGFLESYRGSLAALSEALQGISLE